MYATRMHPLIALGDHSTPAATGASWQVPGSTRSLLLPPSRTAWSVVDIRHVIFRTSQHGCHGAIDLYVPMVLLSKLVLALQPYHIWCVYTQCTSHHGFFHKLERIIHW